MKETYRPKLQLSKANEGRLFDVNKIIEEYRKQGYRLTLRQLYYQLVSRDIIANKVAEYKKLGTLLVKGRMAGVVDWDAIEDRIRVPYMQYWNLNIKDAIESTIKQYKLNRMAGQENYIELWCEKDALAGILKPLCNKYHIILMVNRGYSSCTAMHDAYKRIASQIDNGKKVTILYFGDHDPSGLDMVRDIEGRVIEFLQMRFQDYWIGGWFKVWQIGLTMAQIEEFNPPPNPAKITDPRAKDYIKKFGSVSWEVDALNPEELHNIIIDAVEGLIDYDLYESMLEKEKEDKKKLRKILEKENDGDSE